MQPNPVIKMSIERAHAILGHSSEGKSRQTAAALGILIVRGALKTCELCAIAKAKQKNANDVSKGKKAVKYNGRVYHDIATVKESEEDKALGWKTLWHITAEETVNFKGSKFFVAKVKQKNTHDVSEGEKAVKYNGRVTMALQL